jgi:preprotein translocase subunit SecF
VLVGTYTSVFIASPILIYLGVGSHRTGGQELEEADAPTTPAPAKPAPAQSQPSRRR